MASDVVGPSSFRRYAAIAALVTVVVAAGVVGKYTKSTPTGESATRDIYCWKSGSGSGLCITETGGLRGSGAIISDGVQLSTGAILQLTDLDNRYFNTSGDTGSGDYLFKNSKLTGSGARIDGTINATSVFAGSMTGTNIYTVNSLNSSGSLSVEGTSYLAGVNATTVTATTASSATLYVSGFPKMRRSVAIPLCDSATSCAAGSGVTFRIPNLLAGYTLSGATLDASVAGVGQTMKVNIFNQGGNCSVFTTPVMLGTTLQSSDQSATGSVINSSCRVFSSGQRLVPQITNVNLTAAKGVTLTLDLIP